MVGTAHSEVLSQKLQNVADVFYVPKATHRGIYGEAAMWQRIRTFVNDELGFCRSWQGIVVFTEVVDSAE
uniref:Uncharacterized protein n=1 Tax=Panagrolaimus sp. JU765 TaxID=591449 RepID=A0AC34Q7I7_9BILA